MTRYALIDQMLANRNRAFSIQDITETLAQQLPEFGQSAVSKRCVEKDLNYLEFDSPFDIELEEYWVDAIDKNDRPYRKRCIRYADPTYSIFTQKLSEDEKSILSTALDTLGDFEGLEYFEWLNDLRNRLNIQPQDPIISISKNLLNNSTLIARLYTAIRSQQVIRIEYHLFANPDIRLTDIIPRLIREYNNRWFLVASACDSGTILTFAIDRIEDITPIYTYPFIPLSENIEERFEEIIGVTFYDEAPLQKIIFWVSDISKDYVETKPIHSSQRTLRKEQDNLRQTFTSLKGGEYYEIECRENYELIRELTSFGPELIVVSPHNIVEKIKQRLKDMQNRYSYL